MSFKSMTFKVQVVAKYTVESTTPQITTIKAILRVHPVPPSSQVTNPPPRRQLPDEAFTVKLEQSGRDLRAIKDFTQNDIAGKEQLILKETGGVTPAIGVEGNDHSTNSLIVMAYDHKGELFALSYANKKDLLDHWRLRDVNYRLLKK